MGKYTCEFAEVKLTSVKKGKCIYCGRNCTMTKKFYQTINPFNKNKDGEMKTAKEITDELIAESVEWRKEDMYHKKCLWKFYESKHNPCPVCGADPIMESIGGESGLIYANCSNEKCKIQQWTRQFHKDVDKAWTEWDRYLSRRIIVTAQRTEQP